MHSPHNKQDRHPDIRKVSPGGSPSTAGIVVGDISPRLSEWLPELLRELLPSSLRAIRGYAAETDPQILSQYVFSPSSRQPAQREPVRSSHCY